MDWNKQGWDFHHFFIFGVVVSSEVREHWKFPKAGTMRFGFRTALLLASTYLL